MENPWKHFSQVLLVPLVSAASPTVRSSSHGNGHIFGSWMRIWKLLSKRMELSGTRKGLKRLNQNYNQKHDNTCLRPTCLREVSSHTYVSWQRHVPSPDLSLGSVFAHPCVFATRRVFARSVFGKCLRATTRVFARPVFGKCLRTPLCLRDKTCLHGAFLRQISSDTHMASRCEVSWPGVFAPRNVSAEKMSADAHVSSLREISLPSVSADAQVSAQTVLGSLPKP